MATSTDQTTTKSAAVANILYFLLLVYHWLLGIILTVVPKSLRYKSVKDETVLITGGGSGLGRALAVQFAKLGCRIVIWDINEKGMKETADMVRKIGSPITTFQVDISDRTAVYETAVKVKKLVGPVTILVNNAGVVSGKRLLDLNDEEIDRTMVVNCVSNFWIVKSFLPEMMKANHGHIVTISSVAALSGGPRLSDYCASKFASFGMDESFRYEMASEGYNGIHFSVACPWFINTGMFDGAQPKFIDFLDQSQVAEEIISGVLVNQEVIIIPRAIYLLYFFKSFLPTKSQYYLTKLLGADVAMVNFHGRSRNKVA